MSRRDEDDPRLEELLEPTERLEAEALRNELITFLESPAARETIQTIVRKPVESAILSAIQSTKFQDQLRDHVVEALTPKLAEAARIAAANALKDVTVTIDAHTQKEMRSKAANLLKNAYAETETEASRLPPRKPETLKREPAAAFSQPRADLRHARSGFFGATPFNRLSESWVFPTVIFVSILAFLGFLYYFILSKRSDGDSIANPVTAVPTYGGVASSTNDTTRDVPPTPAAQPSRLYEAYRVALAHVIPTLPQATAEQEQCIARGIQAAEGMTGDLDVVSLGASLQKCAATQGPPSGASRIVATVQVQLTEESRGTNCTTLKPLTVDGVAGAGTVKAFKQFVACTGSQNAFTDLTTIGDYATVGVYFVHRRLHENP